MDTTVEKLLTGGHKLPSSLRVDLDGELIVERNYKIRYLLQQYT